MSSTGLSTLHPVFQHFKHVIHWPLTSIVSDEKSLIILVMILLYAKYLISLADFITLSLVFCSVCVSVICYYSSLFYLFVFPLWSLLNFLDLCVDIFYSICKNSSQYFSFLTHFPSCFMELQLHIC